MNLEIAEHVTLVVGGASGIGLATAEAFASEGADVVLWDCSDTVSDVARRLAGTRSVRVFGVSVDIADEAAVRRALAETTEAIGNIDHLVHAAAIGSGRYGFPFTNVPPAEWGRVFEVNVLGMTHVAHAVAPAMIERRSGTMVFVASVAGQIGSQTDPPYSASKAANINFAQCMAKDLAEYGIRVNTVCPGMVQTPLNRAVWKAWSDQTPAAERLSYQEWAKQKIDRVVPLKKWQTPESIADMILFLSSKRAEHVTGQTINVDGGTVMHA